MIPKSHHQALALADIQALCDNGIAESRTLEYKKDFPAQADSSMGPFLAGLCAFANTLGGDMVIGLRTEAGVPEEITGIEIANLDGEKLRLEQVIRNGLEPRLTRFHVQDIHLGGERYVIVVRVPRSWAAPHKVVKSDRFYARSTVGKYPMDVTELRAAFLMSEEIPARIRRFRDARIGAVMANDELPALLFPGGRLVLHLVPLSAFLDPAGVVDLNDELTPRWPYPMGASGWSDRRNMDGVVRYSNQREDRSCRTYIQLYRSGMLESVAALTPVQDQELYLASLWYEKEVLLMCRRYLKWAEALGFGFPVYALLTLVGMKGSCLGVSRGWFFDDGERLDRDPALFPEAVLEAAETDPAVALKPVFDMVWNAYGYERSFNYDENGNWVGE